MSVQFEGMASGTRRN